MTRLSDGYSLTMATPMRICMRMQITLPICHCPAVTTFSSITTFPLYRWFSREPRDIPATASTSTDMSQETFLRHIEYGADLKYTLIEAETTVLMNTDYTDLYSVTYDTFRDQIVEQYGELEQVGKEIGDASITSHERDGEVAVVRYSNGKTVYVN